MRRFAPAILIAATACGHGKKAPEWQVSGVGNLHEAGALRLYDRNNGDSTECGLAGVLEPTDANLDLRDAYRDALKQRVQDKVVTFTVLVAAETIEQTPSTRFTSGVDQCDVRLGGASVAIELVRSGWGRAAPNAPKEIVDAEAAARAAHAGMWSPQGRALLLGPFAKMNASTVDKLPLTGELSWAQHTAAYWQPRLAYLDVDIEDVITVDDGHGGKLAHWKDLPPAAKP